MLKIEIIGINSNGELELEVDGRPNNGHSTAKRRWHVEWQVSEDCDVDYIEDIQEKDISGSTDIFSDDPPHANNGDKKKWKATVNRDARYYSVYIYNIKWVRKGDTNINTFDPLISIKPTSSLYNQILGVVAGVVAVITALFCIDLLFSKKNKKRWK